MTEGRFVFGSSTTMSDCVVLMEVPFTDREQGWMAEDPTRPGCVGYGPSVAAALESLNRARKAYDLAKADQEPAGESAELFLEGVDYGRPHADNWQRNNEPTGAELTT